MGADIGNIVSALLKVIQDNFLSKFKFTLPVFHIINTGLATKVRRLIYPYSIEKGKPQIDGSIAEPRLIIQKVTAFGKDIVL